MDPDSSAEEAAIKRMAPIISHELRNPLAIIANSSYYIKTKLASGGMDPKVERHLSIIDSEIRHANATLEEILAYARMREPIYSGRDLDELVDEALKALELPDKARLKRSARGAKIHVRVDAELVVKSLRHLARNAAEALALADGEGTLSVSTGASKGTAFAEFADTGPGLPAEALERLFLPFNTTKPRGVGVGLAYARKVMRRHQGDVVHVPGGAGARFRLTLPTIRA